MIFFLRHSEREEAARQSRDCSGLCAKGEKRKRENIIYGITGERWSHKWLVVAGSEMKIHLVIPYLRDHDFISCTLFKKKIFI